MLFKYSLAEQRGHTLVTSARRSSGIWRHGAAASSNRNPQGSSEQPSTKLTLKAAVRPYAETRRAVAATMNTTYLNRPTPLSNVGDSPETRARPPPRKIKNKINDIGERGGGQVRQRCAAHADARSCGTRPRWEGPCPCGNARSRPRAFLSLILSRVGRAALTPWRGRRPVLPDDADVTTDGYDHDAADDTSGRQKVPSWVGTRKRNSGHGTRFG